MSPTLMSETSEKNIVMTKELQQIVKKIAAEFNFESAALASFIDVESGGKGFDDKTGKILIQFEPVWMKRLAPYTPSGAWSVNKVDVQSKEWVAFNDAFAKNKEAAMKSTSIGLGQIMGFHYQRLGFKTVGEMWDYSKESLENQVRLIAKFLLTDSKLQFALKTGDWHTVALIYNGKDYAEMAKKWKREPYNISMAKAYGIYKAIFK